MIQPLASLSRDTQTESDVTPTSLSGSLSDAVGRPSSTRKVSSSPISRKSRSSRRRAVELEGGEVAKGVPASPGTILVGDGIRTVLEVPLEGTLRHLRKRPRAGPLR